VNNCTNLSKIVKRALVLVICGFAILQCAKAQRPQLPPRPDSSLPTDKTGSDESGPLTSIEEEMRAKRAIKYAQREHRENLERADQLTELGKELVASVKKKGKLDREDLRRLDKVEKLARRIRSEAGGQDDDVTLPKPPSDLESAITQLGESAVSVGEQFKKTPRQVISTGVINEANVLLELIKLVRNMVR